MIEADAFPSDHYAVQQQAKFHGFEPKDAVVQLYPRKGEHTLRTEDILASIEEHKDSLALVMLGGVNYYTGQFFKLKEITIAGHKAGAFVGFDLAHAAGNVKLQLHDWDVDFATWCSYKYLNSGPGGVSGVFIHEKHHKNKDIPRFAGWWGHDEKTRFKMDKQFVPMESAAAWQMSNAQILPMAAHWASLEIFDEVGMDKLRAKSDILTAYLEYLILQNNFGFEIITPSNKDERACQLSLLTGADGKQLFKKLQDHGVIADWREPNVIRIAPVPLYNSFEDVWRFVEILKS
jgi:kynureninase